MAILKGQLYTIMRFRRLTFAAACVRLEVVFSLMTKTEMVDGIAKSAAITKKAAAAALDAITTAITKELKKGNNVVITGFGTFRVSHRAARNGVNPQNPSQKIKIKAMKLPVFKAGKALKDAVR